MQHGEDHFERRLAGEFGMLVDRHAAAVVGDRQAVAFLERDLDAVGVAGDRLVHRIVEHFGGEVVQRALVGAADIHAGAPADRLEPFEHLDRGGVVIAAGGGRLVEQDRRPCDHGYKARIRAVTSARAALIVSSKRAGARDDHRRSCRCRPGGLPSPVRRSPLRAEAERPVDARGSRRCRACARSGKCGPAFQFARDAQGQQHRVIAERGDAVRRDAEARVVAVRRTGRQRSSDTLENQRAAQRRRSRRPRRRRSTARCRAAAAKWPWPGAARRRPWIDSRAPSAIRTVSNPPCVFRRWAALTIEVLPRS